jgi:hypothetical protein
MTQDSNSLDTSEYVVRVNPDVAFTMIYEDAFGKLAFTIEVDDAPKKIYLSPRPIENGRVVDARSESAKTRIGLAVDRVKAYFEGQGLSVDLD